MDIYTETNNFGKKLLRSVYLHGEIEKKAGYDFCYSNDKPSIKGEKTFEVVTVHTRDEDVQCVLFYWEVNSQPYGLVCTLTDIEACNFAMQKYLERSTAL